MKQRLIVVATLVSFASLILFLQTTTPAEAGPAGVLVVFCLLYISVLGFLALSFFWLNRLFVRASRLLRLRRPIQKMRLLHAYYYASVLALAPLMLVGMASVGELGLREVLLVTILSVIATVYIRIRTA